MERPRRRRTLATASAGIVGLAIAIAVLSSGEGEPAAAPLASSSPRAEAAGQASAVASLPSAPHTRADEVRDRAAVPAEEHGGGADEPEGRNAEAAAGDAQPEDDGRGDDEADDAPPLREDGTPRDRPLPLGSLSKESIQESMAEVKPLLRACFDEGRKHDPSLAGRVVVEFEIEATDEERGVVKQGSVIDSEVASPFFEACVLQKVAGLEMPVPRGGGVVKVRYPFHFDPGGGFGGEAPPDERGEGQP